MILTVSYRPSPVNLVAGTLPTAGLAVMLTDPWSNHLGTLIAGSKPEHGPGGFEFIAPNPGSPYTLKLLDRIYTFDHKAGLTFLTFTPEGDPTPDPPDPAPPTPPPPPPPPPPPVPDTFEEAVLYYLALIAADVEQIARSTYWIYKGTKP